MCLYIILRVIALTFYKQSWVNMFNFKHHGFGKYNSFFIKCNFWFVTSLLNMLCYAHGSKRYFWKRLYDRHLLYILENGNQWHILEHKFQWYGDMLSYIYNVHKCRYIALQNTQMSILQKRKTEKISNEYWITINKNFEGLFQCCLQKNMSV